MKKTQKLISLVVVLAFALSLCSISAFAAKQIVDSTTTNIFDASTWSNIEAMGQKYQFKNSDGLKTGLSNSSQTSWPVSVADGVITITGTDAKKSRFIIEADNGFAANSGVYTVSFEFMTPETESTKALYIYGYGVNGNPQASVATTRSNGVDTISGITISPNEWYDFECILDTDNHTYTMKVEGTVVKSGAITAISGSDTITRPVDTGASYTYRTISWKGFTVDRAVNTYMDDGVNPYVIGDFSGTGAAAAANFKNAGGSTGVTSQLLTGATVNNGILTVAKGGRVLLRPYNDVAITSGTYTTEFEFMRPETLASGSGVKVYGIGHNVSGGNAFFVTATGTDANNGVEAFYLYTNDGATDIQQVVVNANQWYKFKATFDVAYDEATSNYTIKYLATVNDIVVDNRSTVTPNPVGRIFDYAAYNNTGEIQYRNFTISKMEKDYAIEDVTIANNTITARLISNVAPSATFFAAIYENGALTSLKAISTPSYFTPKTIGTYSCADDEVEVKFYAWASKGLMPVYTYAAQ